MEKHISIKNYPVLHFFANIVDPDGKFGIDDIVKAICTKFELELPNTEHGYNSLNNKLIRFVESETIRELFFELPIYGFVRVYKEYRIMKYKEHRYEFNYVTELQINTSHTEIKRGWDENAMINFKDVMFTLYDKDEKQNIMWLDIFNACWLVFDKGSKENSRNTFERSIRLMVEKLEDESNVDNYGKLLNKYAYFIKEKWDEYLWSKHEQEAIPNTDYWLGLHEFISRNIESWLQGYDKHNVVCRIYTDDHERISKEFNMLNEKYIKLWGKIAIQDERN